MKVRLLCMCINKNYQHADQIVSIYTKLCFTILYLLKTEKHCHSHWKMLKHETFDIIADVRYVHLQIARPNGSTMHVKKETFL